MFGFDCRVPFKRTPFRNPLGVLLALILWVGASCANSAPQANTLTIYDNTLAANWADWSWDSTISFAATAQIHSAANAIAVTHTKGYGGLSLRIAPALSAS